MSYGETYEPSEDFGFRHGVKGSKGYLNAPLQGWAGGFLAARRRRARGLGQRAGREHRCGGSAELTHHRQQAVYLVFGVVEVGCDAQAAGSLSDTDVALFQDLGHRVGR